MDWFNGDVTPLLAAITAVYVAVRDLLISWRKFRKN